MQFTPSGNYCMNNWTLFSNHGHVLVCLARNSDARLRDVAADVGITERAVQKIVRDLHNEGMISIKKNGRRNCYHIHKKKPLRHTLEAHCVLGDLITVVNKRLPKTQPVEPGVVSVEAKVEPVDAKMEPVETKVVPVETRVEPVETKPEAIDPKAEPVEPETKKVKIKDPIERQQGSLF